jgi:hypothetical protein
MKSTPFATPLYDYPENIFDPTTPIFLIIQLIIVFLIDEQ